MNEKLSTKLIEAVCGKDGKILVLREESADIEFNGESICCNYKSSVINKKIQEPVYSQTNEVIPYKGQRVTIVNLITGEVRLEG